ncbi:hypothetical protein [Catellatospora methionotrophica]|uniref:Tc toxin subunit A-related protein n=1 Tax=Catellatospora methionotrophica TaxID=121620 RepID=UPI0033F07A68
MIAKDQLTQQFHGGSALASQLGAYKINRNTVVEREMAYRFFGHFHPYVHELIHELVERSVSGLQAADTDYLRTPDGKVKTLPDGRPRPRLYEEFFAAYAPGSRITGDRPVKDLDFTATGAYSCYNWELFYHVPIAIATHLMRAQRHEDCQRWLHYVFDPTAVSVDPSPMRFWKVRRFHELEVVSIEKVLANLSTQADKKLLEDTLAAIHDWKDHPFRPHVVARWRQSAYMVKTVMLYLDNLIAWGDLLFAEDSGESIGEATQLYVLAAQLLGPRPQAVPRKGWQQPQSYESLRPKLDALGNTFTELEVDIPFDQLPAPSAPSDAAALQTVASIGGALYFCVPPNEKLLGYWDTVADRLFKIRNSLNLQGIFRQLPLFDPPIDPALLAKAAAAGLDISSVLAGLHQPAPLVRFALLVQKATELAQDVSSLGAHLLSAIEKQDAETLYALRARFERSLLQRTELVRFQQWQEAIKAREGVEKSFASALTRYRYYELQLGKADAEITVPGLDDLDRAAMAKLRFTSSEDPTPQPRPLDVDIAKNLTDADGKLISSYEAKELQFLKAAQAHRDMAIEGDTLAAMLSTVPTFGASFEPFGTGGTISFGGGNLAAHASWASSSYKQSAESDTHTAVVAGKVGAYARRQLDWSYQSNQALSDIAVTLKQWRAAQIREAASQQEFLSHQQQIAEAEQIEQFLAGEKVQGATKTSTAALYTWLRREIRALYNSGLSLATDVARKAERALQYELGDPGQSFLQPGYATGREGLLAGEKLLLDVKRMEHAYHDLNRRELELTKNVSLRQLNPEALMRLRTDGFCEVDLSEHLYDQDYPGHYFRRLRAVGVSIPASAGPHTTVACTLTLLNSSIRVTPQLADGAYDRDGEDTERFRDSYGRVESIATSNAVGDWGTFAGPNARDERLDPFEGQGAISTWRIELPKLRQHDYLAIPDVILHVRLTARDGGLPLRQAAETALAERIAAAGAVGSVRLLSLRQDFPTAWAKFRSAPAAARTPFTVTLRPEHYPFWADTASAVLRRVELLAQPGTASAVTVTADAAGTQPVLNLSKDGAPAGLLWGRLPDAATPPPALGAFTWHFDSTGLEDAWLVLTWGTE